MQRLEQRIGGRVGVFALDTDSGRVIENRADERFAMCSTFKWLLAAQLLGAVDRGECTLDERIRFGTTDLLGHAPVTRRHVRAGSLPLQVLAEAAVTVSDNTAANLLLARLGGPAGLTRFARSIGDGETRLDRIELALNENLPGDPRDSTTPRAMANSLRTVLLGDVLSVPSRRLLLTWLRACETGGARLRAGLPHGWRVGDKTGTGSNHAVNDVAIAHRPGRRPIVIAAFLSESPSESDSLDAAHADIGRLVASAFV